MSVAYSSHESHAGQLDFCNWQVTAWQDNVLSINLRQIFRVLVLNQLAIQLSSWAWVDSVPDVIHI